MNAIFFLNSNRYLVALYDQHCLSAIPFLFPPSALRFTDHQVIYATAVWGCCNMSLLLKTDAETLVICNSVKYIVQNCSQHTLPFTSLILQWKCLWFSVLTVNLGKLKWLFIKGSFFLHSQLVKIAILWHVFPLF